MNRLKLSGSRWAGYTGTVGTVDFKDGISVYPVPRVIADRLTAAIAMVEVDEDGNELGMAGVAARLIGGCSTRAPVIANLERQTDTERKVEDLRVTLKDNKAPTETFYTVEQLQAVVDEKGIKGLRAIAEPWNIKGKAIPALIKAIMDAQNGFAKQKTGVIEAVAEAEQTSKPEDVTQETDVVTETIETVDTDVVPDVVIVPDAEPVGDLFAAAAAASGNMAAAITAAVQDQTEPKE